MSEKRYGKRWPSFLIGHVRVENGRSLECAIRDFSSAGARIEIPAAETLPETFDLFFPLTQATFPAYVRWRAGKEIGVEFEPLQSPEAVTPTDPVHAMLLERLLKVEAEKAEMQMRMAELLSSLEHVG